MINHDFRVLDAVDDVIDDLRRDAGHALTILDAQQQRIDEARAAINRFLSGLPDTDPIVHAPLAVVHQLELPPTAVPTHQCPFCGQLCKNGTGLSAHVRARHKETPT